MQRERPSVGMKDNVEMARQRKIETVVGVEILSSNENKWNEGTESNESGA
jgi:hypothetical protein